MTIRTVASEYLKIRKAWIDAKPKAPELELDREDNIDEGWSAVQVATVDDDGDLVIERREIFCGEVRKVEPIYHLGPDQALELAQFMREVFVDCGKPGEERDNGNLV